MKRRSFLKFLTAGGAVATVASVAPSWVLKEAKPRPYTLTDEYSLYGRHQEALARWYKEWHDKIVRQALLEQHSTGLVDAL